MTHCFCGHYVDVSTSFNCTVPGIRLSYFSFQCCMTLSSSHLSTVSHLLYSHCRMMWRQYRVGCVVYNVHEQVMPESFHYLTALHAHSHPCLVFLFFLYHPYIPHFLIPRIFYLLVIIIIYIIYINNGKIGPLTRLALSARNNNSGRWTAAAYRNLRDSK